MITPSGDMTMEQIRMLIVAIVSSILSILTPVSGFFEALLLVWGFNIIAGMRADGVSIITCDNFRWSKFKKSLMELLLYLTILFLFRTIMYLCDDSDTSMHVVKTLTYILVYVYMCNAFKNLVKAYPKAKGLWIIYLFLRFDFKRMIPSNIGGMIEKYEEHERKLKEKEDGTTTR